MNKNKNMPMLLLIISLLAIITIYYGFFSLSGSFLLTDVQSKEQGYNPNFRYGFFATFDTVIAETQNCLVYFHINSNNLNLVDIFIKNKNTQLITTELKGTSFSNPNNIGGECLFMTGQAVLF